MRGPHKPQIIFRAYAAADREMAGDRIAEITLRRIGDRRQPEYVDAERRDCVELVGDVGETTRPEELSPGTTRGGRMQACHRAADQAVSRPAIPPPTIRTCLPIIMRNSSLIRVLFNAGTTDFSFRLVDCQTGASLRLLLRNRIDKPTDFGKLA
jgi:hypothetical protein